MGIFWGSDDTDAVGNASTKITSGLRHLFTGDIPPEIIKEMNRIDEDHVSKRWIADSKIKWWQSSRSIVLLSLTINWLAMTWYQQGMKEYWVDANVSLMMLVAGAFFGSKGIEYMKAGKAP